VPVFILTISLLVLSQSAIFVRMAEAHAVAIGFWRMVIAVPVLIGILLWKRASRDITRLQARQWAELALCGFFLFAHFYTWFISIQKTSLAHSMILFCTNPVFTALGAWVFFQEKASVRHGVAMVLCFVGIFFLLSDKAGPGNREGDLWGVACAILFSAYVLMGRRLRKGMGNLPFSLATYSFCAAFFAVLMVALGLPFFGYSPKTWIAFCGLAFGSTLLGHSLFTYSLQFFHVNFLSISTLVEPVFTAASGQVFFGEPITRMGVLGFLFVGAGIVFLYYPYIRQRLRGRS
jgi:drug/metabolite transporter (DMT)-like permease